jgi:hypothetical protein
MAQLPIPIALPNAATWTLPRRQGVTLALLLPFLVTTLTLPVRLGSLSVGVAYAQQEEKPALGIVPFTRRGEVGTLQAARIEEYLRQMLDAGGAVKLLNAKVIDTGKPIGPAPSASNSGPQKETAATKALDKADKLAVTARTMLEEGEEAEDALKLLTAAAQRYEDNFVELVDFTKLVDAYAQAAAATLVLKRDKDAKAWVVKALTIQPTFVVDARKANKVLQSLVTQVRQELANKPTAALTVECNQKEAEVYVDGVKLGAPPATAAELAPGTHYVQVRRGGASPWGQTFVAKGKPATVKAILQMDEEPGSEIELGISPEDIKGFAASGKFHEKLFKNSAALFAKQVRASHLLYGVVARTSRSLELHLFLYNARLKKTCAIDKVDYDPKLTDLQMKTLDAEGRVRSALGGCGADREVKALPEVFDRGADAAEPPAVLPTPPEPEPEVRVPTKVEPKAEPEVRKPVKIEPKVVPDENKDPYEGLLDKDDTAAKPFYKTWWFWTTVGVLAAAGAGTGIYLASQKTATTGGFTVTTTLP